MAETNYTAGIESERNRLGRIEAVACMVEVVKGAVMADFARIPIDRADVRVTDVRQLVQALNANLGATLVATLAGSRDRKMPYVWATSEEERPSVESLRRLRLAHKVWLLISNAENDYVARTWFIGVNDRLGGSAPCTAIREGRLAEVESSAHAFISGLDG